MQGRNWKWFTVAALCFCFLFVVTFERCEGDEPASSPLLLGWRKHSPVPDVRGVAAPFAGLHGTTLLVGGGANFPDRPPWEGGAKVWYDRVWSYDQIRGWREAGRLPRPLGYGVSISAGDGLICIGGSDLERHYRDVFRLTIRDDKLETKPLPGLPRPIANACGAMLGRTIYIAGGLESPNSTTTLKTFFALDLDAKEPVWKELEAWPGPPRMLAVAAVLDGNLFVVSGTDLSADDEGKPKRRYLNDAYRYYPQSGWKRIADLPHPAVAAPSPAPTIGTSQFLIISGDDGSKVGIQQQKHPGFPNRVLAYSTITNVWKEIGTTPAPRVTVPTVQWGEDWWIVSGEQRPGVRSPEVWSLQAKPR